MNQVWISKELVQDENIFRILDNWMKKYNTSPKHLSVNIENIPPISVELNSQSKHLLEKDDVITSLKEWASRNQKIVIVTSFSIIVLATSLIIPFIDSKNGGDKTFSISPRTAEEIAELSSGVYYIDKNYEITDAPQEIPTIGEEKRFSIPGSDLIENVFSKKSINHILEEYMKTQLEEALDSTVLASSSLELFSIENSAPPIEDDIETPTIVNENGGIEIFIPSSVRQTGLCPNYTSYSYFYGKWNSGTAQKEIADQWGNAGKPSSNGIATLNDRYLVAVSPKFGKVGDNIDIVLEDGKVIQATIADGKGADATSSWGHVMTSSGAVDIIEWEASGAKEDINLGNWKNVKVAKIINYGEAQYSSATEEEIELASANEEEKQYTQLYSSIYGLDEEKVYQILSDMTNSFNGELYQQQNMIEKIKVGNQTVFCNSKEMAFLLSIHNIYRNPEQYGVTLEEIKGHNLYSSNASYAKQIEYFSDILGVDASLNYAICQASCGFDSPMFLNKNNPTNIMINGAYATFPTATAGFIEQTLELLEMKLEGISPMDRIETRVSDSVDDLPTAWRTNVTTIYNYASKNYDTIFETTANEYSSKQSIYMLK